jgi:hypothetical protein
MKFTVQSGLLIVIVLILGILTSLTNTNVAKHTNDTDTKNTAMGSMILSWLLFVAIIAGIVVTKSK